MKKRTYFGEYSLQHWIDLMIQNNIELPEYQRLYVWDIKKATNFIKSVNREDFIPPITIASFKKNGVRRNFILDGQQRLTTIFLSYLGYFPSKEKFQKNMENKRDENDDTYECDETVLAWRYSDLLRIYKTTSEIKSHMANSDYEKFENYLDENFFENHHLSFIYIICDDVSEKDQVKFFASTFRSINYNGIPLTPEESRDAICYMEDKYKYLFKPNIPCIKNQNMDFVRSLAFLFEFSKNENIKRLAYGYSKKKEDYYEEFIYSIINGSHHEKFPEFKSVFPNSTFTKELKKFTEILDKFSLDLDRKSSIIDLDIFYFGLIYTYLFHKKEIDFTRGESLKRELKKVIDECKNKDLNHQKSPGALVHILTRIKKSVEVYKKYEKD